MTSDAEAELGRVFGALHPEVTIAPDGGGVVATARFEPQPEHRGIRGLLHGGMAATVLDHVCARAAGAALGGPVVTGTLDLRYRHPVALDGGPYRVEVRAGRARGRAVRVAGAVLGPDGRSLVDARALFVAR
ncbi:MAG: PaaI family thioesterase [Acidimicrobiales bacterium]